MSGSNPNNDNEVGSALEEREQGETIMTYGPGGHAPFVWMIWLGLTVLAVVYIASFYVPSLQAWWSWKPSSGP